MSRATTSAVRLAGAIAAAMFVTAPCALHAQQPEPPAPPPPVDAAPPAPPPAQPAEPPPTGAPPPEGAPPPYGAPPAHGAPPPGYYPYPPPPGYGQPVNAQGVPAMQLPYEDGDPIPPGYVVETSVKKGLVIAGSVTLGSLWVLSIVGGTLLADRGDSDEGWPLFIPVVGPFIAIGTTHSPNNATSSVLLGINGAGQAAGLAMLIAGLVLETKVLRYRGAALEIGPSVQVGAHGTAFGLDGTF